MTSEYLEQSPIDKPLKGRSIFIIETVKEGVTVKTAFLTELGSMLHMPAIFPNQEYALLQVDELRLALIKHFTEKLNADDASEQLLNGPSSNDTIQ